MITHVLLLPSSMEEPDRHKSPYYVMRGAESRYSRQVRFAPIGEEGQRRIRAGRVAIAGCGALGSFQAEAMARAGLGLLRLIDRDFVDSTNLQRQFLFYHPAAPPPLPQSPAPPP